MGSSGAAANTRGKAFERQLVIELKKAGFEAARVGQFGDKIDVKVEGIGVQAKHYATARFPGWMTDILENAHVLVVGEAPGSGRPARRVVAMGWPLYLELLSYRRAVRET